MIASVVATLDECADRLPATIDAVTRTAQIEVGEFNGDSRRIPLTIDSASREDMEAVTRTLQDIPGILFVDVVFVHFEESDQPTEQAFDQAACANALETGSDGRKNIRRNNEPS